jgi:hypothetical protein
MAGQWPLHLESGSTGIPVVDAIMLRHREPAMSAAYRLSYRTRNAIPRRPADSADAVRTGEWPFPPDGTFAEWDQIAGWLRLPSRLGDTATNILYRMNLAGHLDKALTGIDALVEELNQHPPPSTTRGVGGYSATWTS